MIERPGSGPDEPKDADGDPPVVRYESGVRPGDREPLTKRQRWLVWLFFLLPLAYLAWLIVRSIVQQ